MTYALQPNGRYLDFRPYRVGQSITPGGVMKKSYNDGLYLSGNLAGLLRAGGRPVQRRHHEVEGAHRPRRAGHAAGRWPWAASSRATTASPASPAARARRCSIQNGWTDDLFPVTEGVRAYRALEGQEGTYVALQVGDFGHAARPEQAGRRPGAPGPGRALPRRLAEAPGQAAARRERHRIHADLSVNRGRRRSLQGPQLGHAASAQPAPGRPRAARRSARTAATRRSPPRSTRSAAAARASRCRRPGRPARRSCSAR